MKWQQSLCWFLFAGALGGCTSPTIGYDFDRNTNFHSYRTYAWVSGLQEATGDRRLDNSLLDTRIRTAIDTQLQSKGYTTSANGSPEFFVAYQVGLKDMMKGSSTQNYIGDRAQGTYTTLSDIQPYKEGTLLIDIVDAASKQLVWQASALTEVDQGLAPKEREERITGIVRAMLSHFPPQ